MHRAKMIKQIIEHINDPTKLDDEHVELLNAALVGIKWSKETHDFTIKRLKEIADNNDKEIPDYDDQG